jgi:hypothetical protein
MPSTATCAGRINFGLRCAKAGRGKLAIDSIRSPFILADTYFPTGIKLYDRG